MKGQKPERGRSQGRGARHERSAAKRASILDGSPSGGYDGQNQLQKGAPLYCVRELEKSLIVPACLPVVEMTKWNSPAHFLLDSLSYFQKLSRQKP